MGDYSASITKRFITQIAKRTDDAFRKSIVEHAQRKSRELGEEIEVLFLDEEIADEIISLGIAEYMKCHPRN